VADLQTDATDAGQHPPIGCLVDGNLCMAAFRLHVAQLPGEDLGLFGGFVDDGRAQTNWTEA
jgi:hypothetical protein